MSNLLNRMLQLYGDYDYDVFLNLELKDQIYKLYQQNNFIEFMKILEQLKKIYYQNMDILFDSVIQLFEYLNASHISQIIFVIKISKEQILQQIDKFEFKDYELINNLNKRFNLNLQTKIKICQILNIYQINDKLTQINEIDIKQLIQNYYKIDKKQHTILIDEQIVNIDNINGLLAIVNYLLNYQQFKIEEIYKFILQELLSQNRIKDIAILKDKLDYEVYEMIIINHIQSQSSNIQQKLDLLQNTKLKQQELSILKISKLIKDIKPNIIRKVSSANLVSIIYSKDKQLKFPYLKLYELLSDKSNTHFILYKIAVKLIKRQDEIDGYLKILKDSKYYYQILTQLNVQSLIHCNDQNQLLQAIQNQELYQIESDELIINNQPIYQQFNKQQIMKIFKSNQEYFQFFQIFNYQPHLAFYQLDDNQQLEQLFNIFIKHDCFDIYKIANYFQLVLLKQENQAQYDDFDQNKEYHTSQNTFFKLLQEIKIIKNNQLEIQKYISNFQNLIENKHYRQEQLLQLYSRDISSKLQKDLNLIFKLNDFNPNDLLQYNIIQQINQDYKNVKVQQIKQMQNQTQFIIDIFNKIEDTVKSIKNYINFIGEFQIKNQYLQSLINVNKSIKIKNYITYDLKVNIDQSFIKQFKNNVNQMNVFIISKFINHYTNDNSKVFIFLIDILLFHNSKTRNYRCIFQDCYQTIKLKIHSKITKQNLLIGTKEHTIFKVNLYIQSDLIQLSLFDQLKLKKYIYDNYDTQILQYQLQDIDCCKQSLIKILNAKQINIDFKIDNILQYKKDDQQFYKNLKTINYPIKQLINEIIKDNIDIDQIDNYEDELLQKFFIVKKIKQQMDVTFQIEDYEQINLSNLQNIKNINLSNILKYNQLVDNLDNQFYFDVLNLKWTFNQFLDLILLNFINKQIFIEYSKQNNNDLILIECGQLEIYQLFSKINWNDVDLNQIFNYFFIKQDISPFIKTKQYNKLIKHLNKLCLKKESKNYLENQINQAIYQDFHIKLFMNLIILIENEEFYDAAKINQVYLGIKEVQQISVMLQNLISSIDKFIKENAQFKDRFKNSIQILNNI